MSEDIKKLREIAKLKGPMTREEEESFLGEAKALEEILGEKNEGQGPGEAKEGQAASREEIEAKVKAAIDDYKDAKALKDLVLG